MAGLEIDFIINEPTAALALHFNLERFNRTFIIYDLGGLLVLSKKKGQDIDIDIEGYPSLVEKISTKN